MRRGPRGETIVRIEGGAEFKGDLTHEDQGGGYLGTA
jgi:hypothetical protein